MNKTLNFLKSLHSDLIDGIESGVNTEDEKAEVFECIEEIESFMEVKLHCSKGDYFDYLIKTTTHNIDAGTYASYYAFYLHGYQFAINEESSLQLNEDLEEYNKLIIEGIK